MKIFERKKANIQDYINLTGMILIIWVITTKEVMIGSFSEIFVIDNVLILTCLGVSIEMVIANLSIFITDFKNYLFNKKQKNKYKKGKNYD